MNESNPYEAPATNLQTSEEIGDPQGVAAGQGWVWLKESFSLFKQSPLIWIVMLIIMFVSIMVLAFIPILGQIASNFIWPFFIAGIMVGCAALDDGDDLSVSHLFAGFSEKMGPLLGLGGIYFIMLILVVIVVGGAVFATGASDAFMQLSEGTASGGDMAGAGVFAIIALIGVGLFVPVIMAIWFAPALIILADKGVIESMKLSFKGCLKNIVPFIVYGIIAFVLLLVSMIPFGLGLLVMYPMLTISMYTSYKDIYSV